MVRAHRATPRCLGVGRLHGGAGLIELVEVQILGLPLDLYRQAAEHSDELQREFAFILSASEDHDGSVPARLLRLIGELRDRFGLYGDAQADALLSAAEQAAERIDLTYHLPAEVREAAASLSAMLDEADAYCLAGQHLLTLATAPGPLAFRRWFLGEIVAQLEGTPPTPWIHSPYAAWA